MQLNVKQNEQGKRRLSLMAITQLRKPTTVEVKSAVDNFARIGMPYHGLLRRDSSFLVSLHNAHRTGNVTDAELLGVGKNFTNLFARLPAEKKPAVLQQLDAVFSIAQKHLDKKQYANAVNTLTSATSSQRALTLAARGKFYEIADRLLSRAANLSKLVKQQQPKKPEQLDLVKVREAVDGLSGTGMKYVGLLRQNPALALALHEAHSVDIIYPAELVALGNRFTDLLRGQSESQKKITLRRMRKLFTRAEKHLDQNGVYPAFSFLMQHTAGKNEFADFDKSKIRVAVEQKARSNLRRFKETRAGKVLFTELRFPRRV